MRKTSRSLKSVVFILCIAFLTISVICVFFSSNNKINVGEEDEELIRMIQIEEGVQTNNDLSQFNAEIEFKVEDNEFISPFVYGKINCFAEGHIAGYWERTAIKLEDATHGGTNPKNGVRTRKTVYDPINNSAYILSMTGEVFYAEKMDMYAGIVPTNPKVTVDILSFGGMNTPGGIFQLFAGISGGGTSAMYYSIDRGNSWTKAINGGYNKLYEGTSTETNEVLVVCQNSKGIVLKKSNDFGRTYEDIVLSSSDYNIVKTSRTLNTPDRFVILVQKNSTKTYKQFIYENGELSFGKELPNLKFYSKGKPIHSTKVDTSIYYSFIVNGKNVPVTVNGNTSYGDNPVKLYNKNWEEIDGIHEATKSPGYLLPFDAGFVLSRWTNPRYFNRHTREWVKLPAVSVGYDVHEIQFFDKGNGSFLMVNNSDVGIRFKTVRSLYDIADESNPFKRLDLNHYYAVLHGGDAHANGLSVASYQDQGTELYAKLSDGRYEARKLTGSDGLEAQINQKGNAAWYRHYWNALYYSKFEGGVKSKTYNASIDLGRTWETPRIGLTYIPGEESIYMGGRNKIIKVTYNPTLDRLEVFELPYEFSAVVSTIVASESDPNRLYCTTKDSKFYYSMDRGNTWDSSLSFMLNPFKNATQRWGGSAGEVIEVVKNNPDIVFFASNAHNDNQHKCMVSYDGGKTFTQITSGLDNVSQIRDISVSDDGKIAFSSSFHVFLKDKNKWFPILGENYFKGGSSAKNVVYLEELGMVRFFTSAAGMIDFIIADEAECLVSSIDDKVIENPEQGITLFPVPSSTTLNIQSVNDFKAKYYTVYTINGKALKSGEFPENTNFYQLDVAPLENGTYILRTYSDKQEFAKQFIVRK